MKRVNEYILMCAKYIIRVMPDPNRPQAIAYSPAGPEGGVLAIVEEFPIIYFRDLQDEKKMVADLAAELYGQMLLIESLELPDLKYMCELNNYVSQTINIPIKSMSEDGEKIDILLAELKEGQIEITQSLEEWDSYQEQLKATEDPFYIPPVKEQMELF